MNDTLTRMAELQAEAQRLLRKIDEERKNADFFSHERVHLDMACQRLESAVWALGQTETGYILGRDFGREASHAS
jgi:hypothetical protein